MENESNHNIQAPLIDPEEKQQNSSLKPQEEEKKIPPAPFFSLFRYTNSVQKLQLIFGTISAIAAGAAFPFFLLFFADITTIFDERNRDEAASQGWILCLKFFIVGGVTWITRTAFFILRLFLRKRNGVLFCSIE